MGNPKWRGIIQEYSRFLPLPEGKEPVTLLEGGTSLVPAPEISKRCGENIQVYLKLEGLNPTGSFKDRGMTYAISQAVAEGSKAVVCASTGNTSASAAAYAKRGGLSCYVLIPKGKIALGKLAQAMVHGAEVIQISGNFDQALAIVREISERFPITLVNSINPYRIQGQRTASFEIVDVLGSAPDYHFLPVGNAGNITAYWQGYCAYRDQGMCDKVPKMMGWQAAGSAPIVDGAPVENPETLATAIRIGNPARWKEAEGARDDSGGHIGKVTDDEILDAYRFVAQNEGVFCEPASAASIAGLFKVAQEASFPPGSTIVCTLTGNGLKDPDLALKILPAPLTVEPEFSAVAEVMKLSN